MDAVRTATAGANGVQRLDGVVVWRMTPRLGRFASAICVSQGVRRSGLSGGVPHWRVDCGPICVQSAGVVQHSRLANSGLTDTR